MMGPWCMCIHCEVRDHLKEDPGNSLTLSLLGSQPQAAAQCGRCRSNLLYPGAVWSVSWVYRAASPAHTLFGHHCISVTALLPPGCF